MSDDDDVSITSSAVSEMKDQYDLERILAERRTSDGRQWLVQWKGYPEERSTWEPRESFPCEETLDDWQAQKMRIARGYDKPYDVAAFEERVSAIEHARAMRKAKRRAKRIRLGLPVSTDSDELDSSDEAQESDGEMLLDWPSHSRRDSPHKISRSREKSVKEDDYSVQSESPKKAKTSRTPKSPTSDSEGGDNLSDDSLVEDLRAKEFNNTHKRLKKKYKPRGEHITGKTPDPPSRQMPSVAAQRRQSQPSKQVASARTDLKQLQPLKKIPPAGLDRRQSMPTGSSSRYSGPMNRATGQLKGAVGTGPKRYAPKQSKYQGKPKVQGAAIMGRWDASVKPRKRTTVVPGLVSSSNAKTFGKLSIQRKYEKAGRNEPAPNPENLVFFNPKKDKAVPQPITLPRRNTSPVKSAWEIYQERLKYEKSDLGNLEDSSTAALQVDEDVPMDIVSSEALDVTHAALQTVGNTGSKEQVETRQSVRPTQTTEHQLQDVSLGKPRSESRPDLLSGQIPKSVPGISRKSSVSSAHGVNLGDLSLHNRHRSRHDSDGSLPGPGFKPDLSVPSRPKFTQEPSSDPDARPLVAIIRIGYGGLKVGDVKLKGVDRRYQGMLLRTKVEGHLELWCKVSCTALDYRRYLHKDASKPFAMGFVEPFWDSNASIHAMAVTLNAHASGGLYLQQQFALLVYPTGTADWAFLDPEVEASPKLGLKVIMRGPLQDQLPVNLMPLPDEPRITTVFRHLANIDYKTLIPQNARKNKDPNTFFLMFPPSRKDEHELVVKFLEANKATIYSSYTLGSWDYFTSHVDAGVILIHPTFDAYHLIPALPATLRKNMNVFSIGTSTEPTIDPTSSPPYKITYTSRFACERLFPHGGAVLLTESVFLDDPKAARQILQWFQESLIRKPAGTWKLLCRPGIKDWMAELVDEFPEDSALYAELYSLLITISPPTPAYAFTDSESGTTLVTPNALLETYNSHPTLTLKAAYLVEWFAGWANCHVSAIRRFHVVHPVVVERWGERWKTLDLLTPEDFMAMYKLNGNGSGSGSGSGGGDAGKRRKSVGG